MLNLGKVSKETRGDFPGGVNDPIPKPYVKFDPVLGRP
jgi:hypothetical protein